jgi:hypothetical protein
MNANSAYSVCFDDAATAVMGEAFELACATLRSLDTVLERAPLLIRKAMAIRIIEDATFGERDCNRLHAYAIELLGVVTPNVSEGGDDPRSLFAWVEPRK